MIQSNKIKYTLILLAFLFINQCQATVCLDECGNTTSTGNCHVGNGETVCTCKPGYKGNKCIECETGYFAFQKECFMCICKDIPLTKLCDDLTEVSECRQSCKQECANRVIATASPNIKSKRTEYIIVGVICVVILVTLTIGVLLYRRKLRRAQVHKFYTIQMYEDDYEGVQIRSSAPKVDPEAADTDLLDECIDTRPLEVNNEAQKRNSTLEEVENFKTTEDSLVTSPTESFNVDPYDDFDETEDDAVPFVS